MGKDENDGYQHFFFPTKILQAFIVTKSQDYEVKNSCIPVEYFLAKWYQYLDIPTRACVILGLLSNHNERYFHLFSVLVLLFTI